MTVGDRCTGHCCEGFALRGYEELPQMIKEGRADAKEMQQILDMVVLRRIVQPGQSFNDGRIAAEPTPVFGCKNFDTETRNCRIYETRPSMCRDFPYNEPCSFITCEWDKGRAGEHIKKPAELVPLRRKLPDRMGPKPFPPVGRVVVATTSGDVDVRYTSDAPIQPVGTLKDQRAIPAAKVKASAKK